jgi:hypothetical protein
MIKDCCPVGTELLGNTLNFVAASVAVRACREKLNWLFTMGNPLSVTDPVTMKNKFQSKSCSLGKKSNEN